MRFRLLFDHRRSGHRRPSSNAGASSAAEKDAAAADKCRGIDMLTETAAKDPQTYARIMAEAAATKNAGAILWKIEQDGRPASYLFGTVHLTDERVTHLSPAVEAALNDAKVDRARGFRSLGERHRLGHRQIGPARHVHRRPPPRQPAVQHRVRHGQDRSSAAPACRSISPRCSSRGSSP